MPHALQVPFVVDTHTLQSCLLTQTQHEGALSLQCRAHLLLAIGLRHIHVSTIAMKAPTTMEPAPGPTPRPAPAAAAAAGTPLVTLLLE